MKPPVESKGNGKFIGLPQGTFQSYAVSCDWKFALECFDREDQAMKHRKIIGCLLPAFLLLVGLAGTSGVIHAQDNPGFDRELLKVQDQLLLRSGAVLEGLIASENITKTEPISFETTAGEKMLVDPKLIDKVKKIDTISQRYNAAVDKMKDNAQGHRDMITWCEEQERGRLRFQNQIEFHRKRILVFDPDDRPARTKLGYVYLKDENRWVNEDQFWSMQGYTRRGPRWNSNLHNLTQDQLDQNKGELFAKRKKFSAWKSRLRRMSKLEAVNSLVSMADPQLMPHIYQAYVETKDPELRALYVEVFASARPTTSSAVSGLITAFMDDRSDITLDYLKQDDFNQKQIATLLTKFLVSKNNATVQRAGYALGELGSTNAILALAKALQTRHQVRAAINNSGAQRVQGNAGGDGFQFGGQKAASANVNNEEVLGALKKITGQDFGYSETAYQKWFIQNYTHVDLKARR